MSSNLINFNPMATLSGSANSFQLESQGYMQGAFMDDPVARMWVLPGKVSTSNAYPLWGGIPIQENVPTVGTHTSGTRESDILVPSAANDVTGWTFFNRAHNMIIAPGQPVPLSGPGMSVAYARNGSNLRIPVPIDSSLVASLEDQSITTQVSWDFTTQMLVAYASGTNEPLPIKILKIAENSKIVSFDSTNNSVSWTYGYAALIQI